MSDGVRSDPASWSDPRHKRGLAGEEQAMRFLQSRGWEVVAHRFRVGRIELDLVASRGHLVAFFEVKARRGTAFGSPFEAITGAKRREIVKAARVWMDRYGQRCDVYRFDCIAIVDNKLAPGGRLPTRMAISAGSVYIRVSKPSGARHPCRGLSWQNSHSPPSSPTTVARR